MILTDEQKVRVAVEFRSAAGNAAVVDGVPSWGSSNEEVAGLTVAADGMSAEVVSGLVGVAQISVVADADLGEGVREITGTLDVEVKAAEAVAAVLVPQEPELK